MNIPLLIIVKLSKTFEILIIIKGFFWNLCFIVWFIIWTTINILRYESLILVEDQQKNRQSYFVTISSFRKSHYVTNLLTKQQSQFVPSKYDYTSRIKINDRDSNFLTRSNSEILRVAPQMNPLKMDKIKIEKSSKCKIT